MFVSIASPRTLESKQSKIAEAYSFSIFALDFCDISYAFSKWLIGLELSLQKIIPDTCFPIGAVMPFGLRFGRWTIYFIHNPVSRFWISLGILIQSVLKEQCLVHAGTSTQGIVHSSSAWITLMASARS